MTDSANGIADPVSRVAVWVALAVIVIYVLVTVGIALNWMPQFILGGDEDLGHVTELMMIWTAINLAYGTAAGLGVLAFRPMRYRLPTRLLIAIAVALVLSVPRMLVIMHLGLITTDPFYRTIEWGSGTLGGIVVGGIALMIASVIELSRHQLVALSEANDRAEGAIEALCSQELRIRRQVYDQLHGPLQHQLVRITFGLDAIAHSITDLAPEASEQLRDFSTQLDQLREYDVRALSHSMLPIGVDLGAFRAIEAMLRRLPATIATSFELSPALTEQADRSTDSLTMTDRLALIFAVEEGITNALKHGQAHSLSVSASVTDSSGEACRILQIVVDDDGRGLASGQIPILCGLERHRERLVSRGGTLTLASAPKGGARLTLALPYPADLS